jgi:hypothetical protein
MCAVGGRLCNGQRLANWQGLCHPHHFLVVAVVRGHGELGSGIKRTFISIVGVTHFLQIVKLG